MFIDAAVHRSASAYLFVYQYVYVLVCTHMYVCVRARLYGYVYAHMWHEPIPAQTMLRVLRDHHASCKYPLECPS
jgi:hypothetical protein